MAPRFLDNRSVAGPIPAMVDEALAVVVRNMSTRAVVSGAGREDVYDYPAEALREAVTNAVMHRDYSTYARGTQVQIEMFQDRLVIRNPGGLFGTVTEDDLGQEGVSSSRNGHLATLLQDVTLPGSNRVVCENRGTGIPSMIQYLRRAGGLMRHGRHVTNESLRQLGNDSREATSALTGLVARGLAINLGGRRYATYVISPDAGGHQRHHPSREVTEPAPTVSSAQASRRRPSADRLQEVYSLFVPGQDLRARDVMSATGLKYPMAVRYLNRLLAEGRIVATAAPTSRQRAYRLPGQPARRISGPAHGRHGESSALRSELRGRPR